MQITPGSSGVQQPSSLFQADSRASQAGTVWTRTGGDCVWPGPCRFMFLTLMYFNFYGIACVAVTPNLLVAAVLSGAFYGKPLLSEIWLLKEQHLRSHWLRTVLTPPRCTCIVPVHMSVSVVLLTIDWQLPT